MTQLSSALGASDASLFTRVRRRCFLQGSDTRSSIVLAYWTGVQTLPLARLFSSWILQDHRYEMVDARVWKQVKDEARESPVTLLEHLPIRRGSGGSQKPFSWLSESVRCVFTINTEAGEIACVPHLHILGATPVSSWSLVRVNIV
jgi:hypothetical protein